MGVDRADAHQAATAREMEAAPSGAGPVLGRFDATTIAARPTPALPSARSPLGAGPRTMPGPTMPGPTMPGPTVPGPTVPGPTMPGPTIPSRVCSSGARVRVVPCRV